MSKICDLGLTGLILFGFLGFGIGIRYLRFGILQPKILDFDIGICPPLSATEYTDITAEAECTVHTCLQLRMRCVGFAS